MSVSDHNGQRLIGHNGSAGPHELLRRRARFLREQDRALVELALGEKASLREIAQLLGIPAGTVSRRLWRLSARLSDPLVVALLERGDPLREEYRQLGIEYFLRGQSMEELADLHRMSRREVQKALDFVRGWHGATSGRN